MSNCAAGELLSRLDEDTVRAAQARFARMDSVGQRRMAELHRGRFDRHDARSLEIAPNLWAGVGLVRGGAGTALVGNPEQVAARLREYAALERQQREQQLGEIVANGIAPPSRAGGRPANTPAPAGTALHSAS